MVKYVCGNCDKDKPCVLSIKNGSGDEVPDRCPYSSSTLEPAWKRVCEHCGAVIKDGE